MFNSQELIGTWCRVDNLLRDLWGAVRVPLDDGMELGGLTVAAPDRSVVWLDLAAGWCGGVGVIGLGIAWSGAD